MAARVTAADRSKLMTKSFIRLLTSLSFSAAVVSADTFIDFESPVYFEGPIVGQDGWSSNSYGANGDTFENANIVANGAIAGFQSVSLLGAAGADNFSTAHDISLGLLDVFFDQGDGNDLELSILFQKGETGTGAFGLSEDGFNGGTPDFVLIHDTTIRAYVLGAFETDIGFYIPDHLFQFIVGFDLLGQTYDVRWRDLTAGGAFTDPILLFQHDEAGTHFLGDEFDPAILSDPDIILGARNAGTNSIFDDIRLYSVPEPGTGAVVFLGSTLLISRRRRRTIQSAI